MEDSEEVCDLNAPQVLPSQNICPGFCEKILCDGLRNEDEETHANGSREDERKRMDLEDKTAAIFISLTAPDER